MCESVVVFPEACAVGVGGGEGERVWDVEVESA